MKQPFFVERPQRPLVVAHRGARAHCPENTLAAAILAFESGADLWELDVNYTKDGQLVVMHDDTLGRTTDVSAFPAFQARAPYRVCDFTLAELRTLSAGAWFAAADPFGTLASGEVSAQAAADVAREKVPTLEEALNLTRDCSWRVNVEIKDHAHLVGHTSVTRDVLALIRRLDMVERVLLSSFQHQYLRECREIMPDLATGALTEKTRPADPVALCRELGADAWHPDRRLVTPQDLTALAEAGLCVNIWTVNDMDEACELVAKGATGIITDVPQACLAALA